MISLSTTGKTEFTDVCDAGKSILYGRSILLVDQINHPQEAARKMLIDYNDALMMVNAQQLTH